MNKDKIILSNGTEIQIESGASLGDIRVLFPDRPSMLAAWSEITEENLSEVTVQNSDGITVGIYGSLILENETSAVLKDGSVLTSFHFREKTDLEKRMDALESGQEMQNGAIADLGAVTSALAEAQEGGLS